MSPKEASCVSQQHVGPAGLRLDPETPQNSMGPMGGPGGFLGFLWFFLFFLVRGHEKRVRDEVLIKSDLLAPPDPKIFTEFHENP